MRKGDPDRSSMDLIKDVVGAPRRFTRRWDRPSEARWLRRFADFPSFVAKMQQAVTGQSAKSPRESFILSS